MDDNSEEKKAKGTKKCVIKHGLIFETIQILCLMIKSCQNSQQVFRSDCHNVYIGEINKIALSSNDDKRLQTFNKITTYPYRTNVFKVIESEMITVRDLFVKNYTDCLFL